MFSFFKKKKEKSVSNELIIYSPINGTVKPLSQVDDQVFSQKMIGDGCAIAPSDGKLYSPIDGNLKVAFPTGHAFGIESKIGPEILVHVGVDTVELNGEGFSKKAEQGAKVTKSTLLCDFDLKIISEKAKSSDVIIVMTQDSAQGFEIEQIADGVVSAGDALFKIIKK